VNLDEMPIYVRWIQKISFLNYCYRILVSNELHDRTFDNEIEGNIILQRIGMKPDDYRSILWIYLILIGIVFYTIAAINLTFLRFPPTGSVAIIKKGKTFQNDDNEEFVAIDDENAFSPPRSKESSGNEKENEIENNSLELEMVDIYQDKAEDVPSMLESPFRSASKQPAKSLEIEIKLININLNAAVKKNSTLNQVTLAKDAEHSTEKSLLKNIFVTFQPGRLIALMGGSGSGKTTLLNLIANRIPHSCLKKNDSSSKHFLSQFSTFSVYNGSGDLFFNDLMPSSSLIRTSIGFGKSLF
jgi:ABC-type multidrug transport system fused ATPase/permease subunit